MHNIAPFMFDSVEFMFPQCICVNAFVKDKEYNILMTKSSSTKSADKKKTDSYAFLFISFLYTRRASILWYTIKD